jgi:antirestriction protein ArdC
MGTTPKQEEGVVVMMMVGPRGGFGGRVDRVDEAYGVLAAAVSDLVTGPDWARAMRFAARFRSRSFKNCLLIWKQHRQAFYQGLIDAPEPTWVAGFRQWQTLGRTVIKGQHGYRIFAPVTRRLASAEPSDPAGQWRRLAKGERPRAGESVRATMIGVKTATVFDICQTDGKPLPEVLVPRVVTGQAPPGLFEGLAGLAQTAGFTIDLVGSAGDIGGADGWIRHGEHTIHVRQDMDPAAMTRTLCHDLAHMRMHAPDDPARPDDRGVREVEAESVTMMVAAAHGMDTAGYTIPYVAGWATGLGDRSVMDVVTGTGERVRRTANQILTDLDTLQIPPGDPTRLVPPSPPATGGVSPGDVTASLPGHFRPVPFPIAGAT